MADSALDYYGLTENPFSLSPDPRYLYISAQHKTCLAKAQYAVKERQGLSIVYGDVGTGKTTIARRLYDLFRADESLTVAFITNPNFPTEMQLLRYLCGELGLPSRRSKVEQIQELQGFLIAAFQASKSVLLIVDEAQMLVGKQYELLRQILNFETHRQKLCQLILFGQNELRNKIRLKPSLRSRIATSSTLEPLDYTDMQEMLGFRLMVAGRKTKLFTPDALQVLYDLSHGYPRDVMRLCLNALPLAAVNESPTIDEQLIRLAANELLPEREEELVHAG